MDERKVILGAMTLGFLLILAVLLILEKMGNKKYRSWVVPIILTLAIVLTRFVSLFIG